MNIYGFFVQPFLLGVSSGLFCVSYCVPFIAPYMVLEERKKTENSLVVLKILLGRLLGYLCFGAFFGFLGEQVTNQTVDAAMKASLMILSIILILYTLEIIKRKKESCPIFWLKNKTPVLMGFLMGVKICPPVLMALMYIFTLHNFLAGLFFFSFFFLGTSIYFLPLTFLGFLNKIKEFQLAGRISALIVGITFFIYNFYTILKMFNLGI